MVTIDELIDAAVDRSIITLMGMMEKCLKDDSLSITVDVPEFRQGETEVEAKIITVNLVSPQERHHYAEGSWDVARFTFISLHKSVTFTREDWGQTLVTNKNVSEALDLMRMRLL